MSRLYKLSLLTGSSGTPSVTCDLRVTTGLSPSDRARTVSAIPCHRLIGKCVTLCQTNPVGLGAAIHGQRECARLCPERWRAWRQGGTNAPFGTVDEESSGIIDAKDVVGRGWFLFDAQVHKPHPDPALVEYGQLLALYVRDFDDVYTISD